MKHALPRLASVALPAGVLMSLGLAHAQSAQKLAIPPTPSRVVSSAAGTGSMAPLLATCDPGVRDENTGGCIRASTLPTLGRLLPLSSLFNVTPSGQVSMGTTTPFALGRLYVEQDSYGLMHHSPTSGSDVTTYCDPQGGWVGTFNNFPLHFYTNDSLQQMTLSTAGNLGIGTTSPTAKLHVNGSARVTGQTTLATTEIVSSNDLRFGAAGENSDSIFFERSTYDTDQSVLELVLGDNPTGGAGNDAFIISTRSLDGLTGQGVYQFNSNGDAFKPGGGSWAALSDRRAKHDIQPLAEALEKVLSLQGKTFYYNDPKTAGAIEGLCTGFIAQEVEQVFPEWVGELSDGTKTLNIRGFEALTVEALRELRTEKDAAVAKLESENAELRQRVEALESVQVEVASLKAALATLVENR